MMKVGDDAEVVGATWAKNWGTLSDDIISMFGMQKKDPGGGQSQRRGTYRRSIVHMSINV